MGNAEIESAQQQVTETTFCAFDLETTGFSAVTDCIIEFGAVQFRGAHILNSFNTLVDPGRPLPEVTSRVSGITDEMVAGKPHIDEALQDFCSFIGSSVLIAHNTKFDVGFLRAALQRANKPDLHNRLVDTLQLAPRAFPSRRSYGLQNLATELGLPRDMSHRALHDAKTCMYLFQACVEQLGFMGDLPLAQVLR